MDKLDVLNYFPNDISENLRKYINHEEYNSLEEIRIRLNKPMLLKFNTKEIFTDKIICGEDILKILQFITENSIYSYQKQISEGFITLKGGHRVGISGNVVEENGKVININYIYSLNFRIAKQIIGVSENIAKEIYTGEKVYNTLIVSPPGAGKTTILRDLIRILSKYKTVGVVDERGEIAAMYKNEPQNDLGKKIDILNNINKSTGIKILLRSMTPEILCADEIGTPEDIEAIKYAVTSGVNGIFTAHGENIEYIKKNPILKELLNNNLVERIILLDKKEKGKYELIKNS